MKTNFTKKLVRSLWKTLKAGGAVLAFVCLFNTNAKAQELEFSRVLIISDVQQTVPAGKVWQVVSYLQSNVTVVSNYSATCSAGYARPYYINGKTFYSLNPIGTGSTTRYVTPPNPFPVWLPAGTTLNTHCADDYLSVIEFTVH